MPTYEYECLKCKRRFERFQRMAEEPLKRCPFDGCKGEVRRLVSPGAGLIFKGKGFYQTDYKRQTRESGDGKTESSPKESCPADRKEACPNSGSCPAASSDD